VAFIDNNLAMLSPPKISRGCIEEKSEGEHLGKGDVREGRGGNHLFFDRAKKVSYPLRRGALSHRERKSEIPLSPQLEGS